MFSSRKGRDGKKRVSDLSASPQQNSLKLKLSSSVPKLDTENARRFSNFDPTRIMSLTRRLSPKSPKAMNAPVKSDYPLLDYLCDTDTLTRKVFDQSQHEESATLANQITQNIEQYSLSPFINRVFLISLILNYDQLLNIVPAKYNTMHALGILLNDILPPLDNPNVSFAENYAAQLDTIKILKSNIETFIEKCSPTENSQEEKVFTGLEFHLLPQVVKDLLKQANRIGNYEIHNIKLSRHMREYITSQQKHRVFSKSLDSKSDKELLRCYYHLAEEYVNMFSINHFKNHYVIFSISDILSSLKLKTHAKLIDFEKTCFDMMVSFESHFNKTVMQLTQDENKLPNVFFNLLKKHKRLLAVSSENCTIFVKKSFEKYLRKQLQRLQQCDSSIDIDELVINELKALLISIQSYRIINFECLFRQRQLIERDLTDETITWLMDELKTSLKYKENSWEKIHCLNQYDALTVQINSGEGTPTRRTKSSGSSSSSSTPHYDYSPVNSPLNKLHHSPLVQSPLLAQPPGLDLTQVERPIVGEMEPRRTREAHRSMDFTDTNANDDGAPSLSISLTPP